MVETNFCYTSVHLETMLHVSFDFIFSFDILTVNMYLEWHIEQKLNYLYESTNTWKNYNT